MRPTYGAARSCGPGCLSGAVPELRSTARDHVNTSTAIAISVATRSPLSVIRRAEDAGVVIVAVTETPTEYQRLSLRLGRRRLVRLALGLHPLRAATISPLDQALFGRLLDRVDYVGEVGLDGSREGRPSLDRQMKVFEHILGQPRIASKILTVHSRGAEKATIECLSSAGATAILHWYSGPLGQIDVALERASGFRSTPRCFARRMARKSFARFRQIAS